MTNESRRPALTTAINDCREPHAELIEASTGRAWIALQPMKREEFEALPLPEGVLPVAHGIAAMDEHWFTRSPDQDEDGPMALREIGGHTFGHCARSLKMGQPFGPSGPREVLVEKHHGGHFAEGRRVPFIIDGEGRCFVHIVDSGVDPDAIDLPEGFRLEWLELAEDWVFLLPTPTTAWFFETGDSFQGPIEAPSR